MPSYREWSALNSLLFGNKCVPHAVVRRTCHYLVRCACRHLVPHIYLTIYLKETILKDSTRNIEYMLRTCSHVLFLSSCFFPFLPDMLLSPLVR